MAKTTRFQTDERLWLWLALGLFLLSWCFPAMGTKGGLVRPIVWLWEIIAAVFSSRMDWRTFFGASAALIIFSCISAIASIVAAWLIHCVIVMVRSKASEE
jgi:hypothetical protein